uniref:Uncharacterized protein n=1 Tax=uncultured marine thaumarchaeote KM3_187_A08 TaxID=1456073 RepID=A0A075GRT7_9ARCH|nr:hypothetical protein [uncultured marine thaumarchaeote KM3_187_A08]
MTANNDKTLLIVLPYGIGWKSIINEKNLEILTNSGLKIILLCEPNMINSTNPDVVIKTLKKIPRTKSEIAIGLLRNYVFADTSKPHSETLEIKISELDNSHPILSLIRKSIGKLFAKSTIVKNILAQFDSALFNNSEYDELFADYNPDFIFVTYPFSFYTYPILRHARKSQIPILGYVPSWDNLTSKWEVPVKLNKLLVWNNIMKEEAINFLDYSDECVSITGVPQFDIHSNDSLIVDRKKFIKDLHGDENKKILLYATGTAQLSDSEPFIVKMIYDMIRNNKFDHPCQLLLRVHPRRSLSDFKDLFDKPDVIIQTPGKESKEFKDSGYVWKSDFTDYSTLSNTLYHADVMINVASTITIESCLFDTPVVNIGFDADLDLDFNRSVKRHFQYSHYLDIVESNGVKIANSEQELGEFINRYLNDPALESAGRNLIVDNQCSFRDGKSSERLLRYIIDFTKEYSV